MKKQFNVKLVDGTNSVIGCHEEQLPDILKYHFSGEQLETAVVTELPQTIEIKKKTITYKTLDSFTSEVDNEPIFKILRKDHDSLCYIHLIFLQMDISIQAHTQLVVCLQIVIVHLLQIILNNFLDIK
jgi:predicted component of type VI protein secretion system